MKYLCLIYREEKRLDTVPQSELQAIVGEYFVLTDDLKQSGQYLAAEALQPVRAATTVRVRNGKVSTTDGPFAETREQLGGFYLINGRDLNDAIQVAAKIPGARLGSVEVRPVVDFSKPG
ncbi:MAG TPA: YciI family protein [Gemmatimonadales bacterium]|nr:YciI family protein [Gemmatimonadales bacterium]